MDEKPHGALPAVIDNRRPSVGVTSEKDSDTNSCSSTITNNRDLEANQSDSPLEQTDSRTVNPVTNVLSRTLSRVRTSDALDPGPPPDGGFQAWLTACLVHLVIFNTWGFVNSFGLFQTYYVNTMRLGPESQVAWIGSVQVFILFAIGTFSGRALDAGFFKITFIIGSVIYVAGIFLLSLCQTYWQVFLAQSIAIGIGFGMVFVPSMALLSTYFLNKRSTALGIAVTGSATGGLVFPAIAESLLPTAGFAWTVRTMGFLQLVVAIVCCVFLKPRLPPRKSGPLVEWSAFREAPYTLYLTGAYFFFWAVYTGFYFIGTFGRNILGASQSTSIQLLLVMNGVGIVGRIVPNLTAEKVGPMNLMIPIVGVVGLISYCWLAVASIGGLWAFTVVYGIFAAGIQGLFPVVLTSLTSDPKKLGVRTGMGFGVVSFAVLTGPPLSGALIQRMNGSYIGLQVFSGSCMVISVFFLTLARAARVGWKIKAKI